MNRILWIIIGIVIAMSASTYAFRTLNDSYTIGSLAKPDDAAVLQIDSKTKGLLPPRLTTIQRDDILTPPNGLMLFNSSTNELNIYDGTIWGAAGGGGGISAWLTAVDYEVGDIIYESNIIYRCNTLHTSGVFATDIANWTELINQNPGLQTVQMDTALSAPSYVEGLLYYDQTDKSLVVYNDDADLTWQLGREVLKRVTNNTLSIIENCSVVFISGDDTGIREISKANATSASTATSTIGITTSQCDAALGSFCEVTQLGEVNGCATNGLAAGDQLFLSTTDGLFTITPPTSPNFNVRLGSVGTVDAVNGSVDVAISIGSNWNDIPKFWNGSTLEVTDVTIITEAQTGTECTDVGEPATCAKLSFEKLGGGDVNIFFNGDFTTFSSTPAAKVVLSSGTDILPTLNYVYVLESTGLLTSNTTGWPATQHAPIATVLVQSVTDITSEGAYKVHAWTDHLSNGGDMGHVAHLNYWIRNQHATWTSGMITTPTYTASGVALDNVDVAITAGTALQLHPHATPAYDTSVASTVHVWNDFTTAYNEIADLNEIIVTADEGTAANPGNVTLRTNNSYYSIVLWQSVNEVTNESKIFASAPVCKYANESDAESDIDGCSVYTFPASFKGTGVLLARLTMRYTTASTGTIVATTSGFEDLTGLLPGIAAGGAGAGGSATTFSDTTFRIFDNADNTKILALELAGVATATTRTLSVPDLSGNFVLGDALTYSQNSIPFINGSKLLDEDTTNFTFNDTTDTLTTKNLVVTTDSQGTQALDIFYKENFEKTVAADFTTGNNAAFDNGGVLSGTLADDITTEINGLSSLKYTTGAASTNDWIASPVIAIAAKQQTTIGIQGYYSYDGAVDQIALVAYDDTGSTVLTLATDFLQPTATPKRFAVSFPVPTTSSNIKWGFQVITSAGSGDILLIDDVEITTNPFVAKDLLEVTDWEDYTPTVTYGTGSATNVTHTGKWRRVGDSIEIEVRTLFSSTSAAFNTPKYSLPSGLSIDTSKITVGAVNQFLGSSVSADAAANTYTGDAQYATSTSFSVNYNVTAGAATGTWAGITQAAPFTFNSGDWIQANIKAPILGWASSSEHIIAYNSRNAENLVVEGSGNGGTPITANDTDVTFTEGTDTGFGNANWNGTQLTIPEGGGGVYTISGMVRYTTTVSRTTKLYRNGSLFSVLQENGSSTRAGFSTVLPNAIAGEVYSIRQSVGGTLSNSTTEHYISISKIGVGDLLGVPVPRVAYVKDIKVSGTSGGTFTSGSYQTRTLNTLEGDTEFISLDTGTSRFTLSAGTYDIEASAPAFLVDLHKAKLRNITDGVDSTIGTSEFTDNVSGGHTVSTSLIKGRVTLTASKTFEIQHRCLTTAVTSGFGQSVSFGDSELYTTVKITKVN